MTNCLKTETVITSIFPLPEKEYGSANLLNRYKN